MGLFDGIGSAKIGRGGIYFLDETMDATTARYIVDITRVYSQVDRNGGHGFIIEGMIAWSNNAARRQGIVCSQYIAMKWDGALGMIKGFLAACNGADPGDEEAVKACFTDANGQDITEAVAEFAVSQDNPLAGTRLELNCAVKPKKRSQGNFTHHNWKPYDEAAFAASLQA